MIARGEVNVDEVRERINDRYEDVDFIVERYTEAYEGSGLDADEIWEEIICDSLGDMNAFASVEVLGEMNDEFLEALKEETRKSQKDARGPPRGAEGRASRKTKKLYVFPPYNESHSDANERATRWAHRQDVKAGYQCIISYHDDFYLIQKFDNMELGYQIVDKLTEEEYSKYIKEYWEDGKNFSGQSGKESINTISSLDRERNWTGGGKHSSDSSSVGQRGKNIYFQQMAGEQIGKRKNTSDRGGNLRSGLSGGKVNNTDRINSSIPVKQTFVDVFGQHRNVLGIGDGIYAQDVKTIEKEIKNRGNSGRIKSIQRVDVGYDIRNSSGISNENGRSGVNSPVAEHGRKDTQMADLATSAHNGGERIGRNNNGDNKGSGTDWQGQDVDERFSYDPKDE